MSDDQLALSILRKVAADWASSFLVERFDRGGGHAVIDSSWVEMTEDELGLLERLQDADQGTVSE